MARGVQEVTRWDLGHFLGEKNGRNVYEWRVVYFYDETIFFMLLLGYTFEPVIPSHCTEVGFDGEGW